MIGAHPVLFLPGMQSSTLTHSMPCTLLMKVHVLLCQGMSKKKWLQFPAHPLPSTQFGLRMSLPKFPAQCPNPTLQLIL